MFTNLTSAMTEGYQQLMLARVSISGAASYRTLTFCNTHQVPGAPETTAARPWGRAAFGLNFILTCESCHESGFAAGLSREAEILHQEQQVEHVYEAIVVEITRGAVVGFASLAGPGI